MAVNPSTRARFREYKGKRIYVTDGSGLGHDDILRIADKCAEDVRAQPLGSVLAVIHAKDAIIDWRIMEKMRWLADGNRPHVRAAAVSGLAPVHRMILKTVSIVTRRDFLVFETLEEALDALAKL
ncbi:MAG: hypothetical protein QM704_01780 [Anaeromyxobacteraceae bacterium]